MAKTIVEGVEKTEIPFLFVQQHSSRRNISVVATILTIKAWYRCSCPVLSWERCGVAGCLCCLIHVMITEQFKFWRMGSASGYWRRSHSKIDPRSMGARVLEDGKLTLFWVIYTLGRGQRAGSGARVQRASGLDDWGWCYIRFKDLEGECRQVRRAVGVGERGRRLTYSWIGGGVVMVDLVVRSSTRTCFRTSLSCFRSKNQVKWSVKMCRGECCFQRIEL